MHFSRRKIIKSLGIAAAATATGMVPGLSLFATENADPGPVSLNGGHPGVKAILIGAGNRGYRFGKFSMKYPGQLSIMAMGEPIAERRLAVQKDWGLKEAACHKNWETLLLNKPEAEVAIIASAGNYSKACSAAILSGYNVWVDRPVSMDPDEIMSINKLARENNRQLLFCFIHDGKLNFMDHHLFEKNPAEA